MLELDSLETPFLIFTEIAKGITKTHVVQVVNRKNKVLLGTIKWYGSWRQYCFYPESNKIFNRNCLSDIESVIRYMNAEWHANRRAS